MLSVEEDTLEKNSFLIPVPLKLNHTFENQKEELLVHFSSLSSFTASLEELKFLRFNSSINSSFNHYLSVKSD